MPIGGAGTLRAYTLMRIALGLNQDRSDPSRPYRDARVSLGAYEAGEWQQSLAFSTGNPDLAEAVGRGDIDVAAINPSAFLDPGVPLHPGAERYYRERGALD